MISPQKERKASDGWQLAKYIHIHVIVMIKLSEGLNQLNGYYSCSCAIYLCITNTTITLVVWYIPYKYSTYVASFPDLPQLFSNS